MIELSDSEFCENTDNPTSVLKIEYKPLTDWNLQKKWWGLNPFESTGDINYICLDRQKLPNGEHTSSLAKIRSKKENDMFAAFVQFHNEGFTWIAGSDSKNEGEFLFDDGSPMGYFNWEKNEPNDALGTEDCIEMNTYPDRLGLWNDVMCTKERQAIFTSDTDQHGGNNGYYICEKPCTLADVFQESTQFWKFVYSSDRENAPDSYFGMDVDNKPALLVNVDTDKCLAMTTVEVEDENPYNRLRNAIETVDCEVNPSLNLWFFKDTGDKPAHSSDLETKYCVGSVSFSLHSSLLPSLSFMCTNTNISTVF